MRLMKSSSVMLVGVALLCGLPAAQASPQVVLPPPNTAFSTVFDFTHQGKLIAFDGFSVLLQRGRSAGFDVIGALPAAFKGAADPAFIAVSPDGERLLLGAGAGGFKFPDPQFNGNLFLMPARGGTARLVARLPFHVEAKWVGAHEVLVSEGESLGPFTGSVELLDVDTGHAVHLVGPVPGDPSGVAVDRDHNLYVGLGSGQDPARTGEIRRFTPRQLAAAHGAPVPFDDGELVATALSASTFAFDAHGFLWVGGGDLFPPVASKIGFVARIDPRTGAVVERFDPVDGNPDDGQTVFFGDKIDARGCRLAIVDVETFFTGAPPIVYQRNLCHDGDDGDED